MGNLILIILKILKVRKRTQGLMKIAEIHLLSQKMLRKLANIHLYIGPATKVTTELFGSC